MSNKEREKPALVIIDMVKDNLDEDKHLPITPFARQIIDPTNKLIAAFRIRQWPIVFSTDAYHTQDFIFTGSMKPHSLAGMKGAEIMDELDRRKEDLWVPKSRFSAFFKTGLEKWLRDREVSLCVVAGIATNFCVLTTVLDALSFDFKAILLEDCTAASSRQIHDQTLSIYRRNPLYPLLRVATSSQLLAEILDAP